MDEKIYNILKILSNKNRLPTLDEIELIEGEYKSLLELINRDGYIINLNFHHFEINKSTANITTQGYYYINNWETIYKLNK